MNQKYIVKRNLSRFQNDILSGAFVKLRIEEFKRKYEIVAGVVFVLEQFARLVRTGNYPQAAVLGVGIVDRNPYGTTRKGSNGPVASILMPGYSFAVMGGFAKIAGIPNGYILSENLGYHVEDVRVPRII